MAVSVITGVPISDESSSDSLLEKFKEFLGTLGISPSSLSSISTFGGLAALISTPHMDPQAAETLRELFTESEFYQFFKDRYSNIKDTQKFTEALQNIKFPLFSKDEALRIPLLSEDDAFASGLKELTDSEIFKSLKYVIDANTALDIIKNSVENGSLSEEDTAELEKLVKSYGTKGAAKILEKTLSLSKEASSGLAAVMINAASNLMEIDDYYDGTASGFSKYIAHATVGAVVNAGADTGVGVVKVWDWISGSDYAEQWTSMHPECDNFDEQVVSNFKTLFETGASLTTDEWKYVGKELAQKTLDAADKMLHPVETLADFAYDRGKAVCQWVGGLFS